MERRRVRLRRRLLRHQLWRVTWDISPRRQAPALVRARVWLAGWLAGKQAGDGVALACSLPCGHVLVEFQCVDMHKSALCLLRRGGVDAETSGCGCGCLCLCLVRVQRVHRASTRKRLDNPRALVRLSSSVWRLCGVCVAAVMVGDACRSIVISVLGRLLFDVVWWLDLHK